MFSSLTVRNFRIYWIGMFVSLVGTWLQIVAQSWLVFQLTNSALLLGTVGFLNAMPVFFLSLFGGVAADRVSKKKILIFTQTSFMLLAFILAVMTQLRLITTWQIMVIALLDGIVMAFDAPSRQAVVVELVGRKHLMNAIVLNSVAFNSSRMIGPALAGILVVWIGLSGCFYLNGISFLAVLVALFMINVDGSKKYAAKGSTFANLKEGLSVIRKNRIILALVGIVGISSLFGVSYTILMPIFARDVLHVGLKGFGALMSSTGIGALLGALVLAHLGDRVSKGKLLVAATMVFSLSLALFSLSAVFYLSVGILVLLGASSVIAISLVNTLLQTMSEDEFRGRVMSIFMLTFAGMMPFGNLLSGALSQVWGVSFTVMLEGLICLVFFTIINIKFPEIRKI